MLNHYRKAPSLTIAPGLPPSAGSGNQSCFQHRPPPTWHRYSAVAQRLQSPSGKQRRQRRRAAVGSSSRALSGRFDQLPTRREQPLRGEIRGHGAGPANAEGACKRPLGPFPHAAPEAQKPPGPPPGPPAPRGAAGGLRGAAGHQRRGAGAGP
eukprot:scaffold141_cov232-Pinguiococcus_pyrenoidosus.AAC.4